jgi:hypothetical protein
MTLEIVLGTGRPKTPGMRMRWIAERLAEQAFGRGGIAQRRQQEVDSGTRGIDGPIEVTPSALHSNIRLIDTTTPLRSRLWAGV